MLHLLDSTNFHFPLLTLHYYYRRLIMKQTMDAENILLEQDKVIDFPLKSSDLSRYDGVLHE